MKLGVGSYTYAWAIGVPGRPQPARLMTAEDLVDRAAAMGVHLVQIADNQPLDRLDAAARQAVADHARSCGVDVEVGTRGIRPENIRTYLDIAAQFGSAILRVVVDTADHHPDADEVIRHVRTVLPDLERHGIALAIENHDRFNTAAFRHILQSVDHPLVGICLDTVNSFGALEGPSVVVDSLAPMTLNLHIKDFSIRRADHLMGFMIEGTPAGDGRLNVPWILGKLREYGREVNGILELWPPPEGDIEATVRKEAAWAEQSVAYLRQLIKE